MGRHGRADEEHCLERIQICPLIHQRDKARKQGAKRKSKWIEKSKFRDVQLIES